MSYKYIALKRYMSVFPDLLIVLLAKHKGVVLVNLLLFQFNCLKINAWLSVYRLLVIMHICMASVCLKEELNAYAYILEDVSSRRVWKVNA